MPYKNKEKQKEAQKRYYSENREKYLRVSKERTRSFRKMTRFLKETTPCADCGIQYPYYIMDFDHIRGEKLFNIAQDMARISSVKKLLEEISKCEIVCSNCHRHRSWMRITK